MDGTEKYDLSGLSEEQLEELQEEMEDKKEEEMEDNIVLSQELQESYGSPTPEEKYNAHTFLHKSAFESTDTVRTTFLHEGELGRPIFTVRFMLDMEDVANYYLNPILKQLKLDSLRYNAISNYFNEKIRNVTHSGMSNKGFAMNLNVTQKKDMTRKKLKTSNIDNLKGGAK